MNSIYLSRKQDASFVRQQGNVPVRKLPALKLVSHALNSIFTYRDVGIRLGIVWIGLLFVLGVLGEAAGPPDPAATTLGAPHIVFLLSAAVGLIGISSMAVGWHRFVLRDDVGSPWRIDAIVWRYVGNTVLITLMIIAPFALLASIVSLLHPAALILLAPASVLAGAMALRLSVKLPAIALERRDFGFREALSATDGNFWPLAAVFLLNAAIIIGALLVLSVAVSALALLSPMLASLVGLTIGAMFQLFYTLFNASIFTALYGFFVEGRDF